MIKRRLIQIIATSLGVAMFVFIALGGKDIRADELPEGQEQEQEYSDPEDPTDPEDEKETEGDEGEEKPSDPDETEEEKKDNKEENKEEDEGNGEEEIISERELQVRAFVERLYTTCLGREADKDGVDYWTENLLEGNVTGASVASLFVFSDEYINMGKTDDEYLNMLYLTFFDREADSEGFMYWKFQLEHSGCSRKAIFQSFVNSPEYGEICNSYEIIRGSYVSDDPKDSEPENALMSPAEIDIYRFVERLYGTCLGRESDNEGIKYWTRLLSSKTKTGAEVSYEFVFSEEYLSQEHTDEEFITMLYYTFFNREPDEEGFNFWLDSLQGTLRTRKYIFENFVNSAEFKDICESYGIDRGAYYSDDPCDQYTDVAVFATRLYMDVLGREYDKDGLDYWTLSIGSFELTPMQAADFFFESDEFKDKNLSDKEYIEVLYNTCMGRQADEEGEEYWLGKMEEGIYDKVEVRKCFFDSPEFINIMKAAGMIEKPIVQVARTQIGQQGGAPYYNWYGYNYRIAWCACFVSWCANECGYIDSGIMPKYKWCMDAKEWFIERSRWISGNQYRPKGGDIIFFDWNSDGVIDHTGVVVGTDATGKIKTIEGNKDDAVRNDRVVYVGDPTICGYGIPGY